jgi:pre-rRNA-processing protein TSR2
MASTSLATTEAPPPAPNPGLILFARGVIARLELWPVFRAVIEHGYRTDGSGSGGGGPSSREMLLLVASEIVEVFEERSNDKSASMPDAEYITLMLAQVLEDEFDATVEDWSDEVVAEDVVALWGAGEDVVEMLERKAEAVRGKKVDEWEEVGRDGDGDGDEDEDEWEDEESGEEGEEVAPQLVPAAAEVQRPARPEPFVDEDGFTLVQKGR